jgi:type IV secretory pathway TraG/TraD family ATPase VirD4
MGRPGLASSYWGTNHQVNQARRKAIKQISKRKHNEVSLYIGINPVKALERAEQSFGEILSEQESHEIKNLSELLIEQEKLENHLDFLNNLDNLISEVSKYSNNSQFYLTDMQRGTFVCGAPGSGKTFSIIDPLLRSALEQGFPTIVYDFKYPGQAGILAPYAAMLGYDVRIFAPGFQESESVNVLDFLRDCIDGEMSGQIASVMNKNFNLGGKEEDPFFSNAANQLIQAVFMLAKASPNPDLISCQAFLSLTELVKRLEQWQARDEDEDRKILKEKNPDWERYAINKYKKDWIMANFGQIISVGKSEKTLSSIIGVANNNLTRFMKPNIAPHFTGSSSFDFWLEGRQLLIVGMDRVRRDTIGPLVATALHLIVSYNLTLKKRKDPLIVALDELPTLYLPYIQNWLNENRSDGFCGIIGLQNMNQLEKTYGKEMSRAIVTGCTTKVIFNPGEPESAEFFSKILGDEEVYYKSRSRSTGKGGGSTSTSDQDKTRKLFEPSQFLKMPAGTAVIISPGFTHKVKNKKEANIPILKSITISQNEINFQNHLEKQWNNFLIDYCQKRKRLVPHNLLDQLRTQFCCYLDEIFLKKNIVDCIFDWEKQKPLWFFKILRKKFIHLDKNIFLQELKIRFIKYRKDIPPNYIENTIYKVAEQVEWKVRDMNFDLSSRLDYANTLLFIKSEKSEKKENN